MGYRKFKADYLFTGTEILQPGAVLITDEQGIIEDIANLPDAGDEIESFEGLLTPGFINTHCHLELSHMKGKIPEGTGLVDFVTRVMKERKDTPELVFDQMWQAHEELYATGTVAVGDICNTTDSINTKMKSRLLWRNFIEVAGFTDDKAEERLEYGIKVLREFEKRWPGDIRRWTLAVGRKNHPQTRSSLTPHAPYSVSHKLFELINEFSAGEIITIHNQESSAENDLYLHRTGLMFALYNDLHINPSFFKASGKTSLQTFLPLLHKASSFILVHNTFTSPEDISFAVGQCSASNLFFSICINANRYIESRNPPLLLLRENNCNITIGTDSYASNRQLNMLNELKTIQEEFSFSIPLAELLQWATINGAKALQFDAKLGSFEKGKQPGIVLIDKMQQHFIANDASARRLI